MSSSPLPIRRAGPTDTLSRSAKDQLVITPSGNLYGSTPGGTRIVYSREQLLSLASSPLSKTPPHIPAEISRSPDKNGQFLVGSFRSNGNSQSVNRGGTMEKAKFASAGQVFSSSGSQHQHQYQQNGNGNDNGTNSSIARSPPNTSRSPGNAFNFGNGSMSPNVLNHSTSFKERMASAQQQPRHQSPRQPLQARNDSSTQPSSSNEVAQEKTNGNAAHGDEQFSMDL